MKQKKEKQEHQIICYSAILFHSQPITHEIKPEL